MSWRKNIFPKIWRDGGYGGEGTPSNEKGAFEGPKAGKQDLGKSRSSMWWPEQNSEFIKEKKKDKPRKGAGVPQVKVMDSHWHFLKKAVPWSNSG